MDHHGPAGWGFDLLVHEAPIVFGRCANLRLLRAQVVLRLNETVVRREQCAILPKRQEPLNAENIRRVR